METFVMIAQFIMSLSLLVVLHEFGHFLPARVFGMRVEKFYLFFDPYFSLFKFKKGETEYGIGWLPLGGYVKISGMVDESMDTESMNKPAEPWEFRAKPAWQRLIVMLGGVTVNFILGFFIFAMLLWVNGRSYLPMENVPAGILVDEKAKELGLQEGDIILQVGEKPFTELNGGILLKEIVLESAKTITVNRNGQQLVLDLKPEQTEGLASYKGQLIGARFTFVADSVIAGFPAAAAGMEKGDSLIGINNTPMAYYNEYVTYFTAHANESLVLNIVRNGEPRELNVTLNDKGQIGVQPRMIQMNSESYGLGQSLTGGVTKGVDFIGDQLKSFGKMFSGEIKASESLGGFVSIGKLFPNTWDWTKFWHITAVLSLVLGFMNLLPIPALDGGHVVFLLIEMIIGKPLPQKALEYFQMIGMLLLFGLLIFANGMDIFRLFKG